MVDNSPLGKFIFNTQSLFQFQKCMKKWWNVNTLGSIFWYNFMERVSLGPIFNSSLQGCWKNRRSGWNGCKNTQSLFSYESGRKDRENCDERRRRDQIISSNWSEIWKSFGRLERCQSQVRRVSVALWTLLAPAWRWRVSFWPYFETKSSELTLGFLPNNLYFLWFRKK